MNVYKILDMSYLEQWALLVAFVLCLLIAYPAGVIILLFILPAESSIEIMYAGFLTPTILVPYLLFIPLYHRLCKLFSRVDDAFSKIVNEVEAAVDRANNRIFGPPKE